MKTKFNSLSVAWTKMIFSNIDWCIENMSRFVQNFLQNFHVVPKF